MRRGLTIVAVILLTLTGIGNGSAQDRRTMETTVVRVMTRPARPLVGRTFVVSIQVRGARDVGSVPFSLFYDPAVLEYVPSSAREGRFLSQGGAATVFLATPSSRFNAITVGNSRLGSGPGASGRGTLCTLRFKVLGPGTSTLSLNRAQVLGPNASPQPATFLGTEITGRRRR